MSYPASPSCPRCGATMIARKRRFDGAPFWGCSSFPDCRGTREVALGAPDLGLAAVPGVQSKPAHGRGMHFDRIVLACGAVGFAIGLGFIVAGLTSGPKIYALVGASDIFLMALPVLLSPRLPRGYARSAASKIACFIVFTTLVRRSSRTTSSIRSRLTGSNGLAP